MIAEAKFDWHRWNQSVVAAELARVRRAIEQHAGRPSADCQPPVAPAAGGRRSALESLVAIFGLTPFERDILLLSAGADLDSGFADVCHGAATFGLALAALPDPHWTALSPGRPLRHWKLIELGAGTVTNSPLRIDERILNYLAGVDHYDERLAGLLEPAAAAAELPATQQEIAARIVHTWSAAADTPQVPAIQLCGSGARSRRAVAAAAAALLHMELSMLPAHLLPAAPAELELLVRLVERECFLRDGIVLLECDTGANTEAIAHMVERLRTPLLVSTDVRRGARGRAIVTFDVPKPDLREQHQLWSAALPKLSSSSIDRLLAQYQLNPPDIRAVAAILDPSSENLEEAAWDACRAQARARFDGLAQRVETAAGWDALVLPAPQLAVLREIAYHVRERHTVYENWGFSRSGTRGTGISAIFAGASGTGKTLAAEVLAQELRLDLYRIDLSSVVSKYIGETEKNLRRVFDVAEESGAILLFDEADALFGRRTEVKDSHDRYANIEVSYLLQRVEAYRGLAILTTNLQEAIDQAFLRRIRFIVHFPFPDAAQRAEIWRRVFPPAAPLRDLDFHKLAKLNLSGGHIHNIAVSAAFAAAHAREPVGFPHILLAARAAFERLGKPFPESEVRGWR